MVSSVTVKFKKNDRVQTANYIRAAEFVKNPNAATDGWPGRWEYFDVPANSTGTLIRSSYDSGPSYKIILWDFNGREGEVHKANIKII